MPSNVRFGIVAGTFKSHGWWLLRVRGSHHIFTDGSRIFAVPVHHNEVRHVYVRQIQKILDAKP